MVFEKGHLLSDGHAHFFAELSIAVNADLTLTDIDLAVLLPFTALHQVHLSQGYLSATGHVEYAPTVQDVRLNSFKVQGAKGQLRPYRSDGEQSQADDEEGEESGGASS
ncbi:MAG TPA: hypothetical protein PKN47_15020 [Nitrospira sp.]|nr:hypothetical protein [Nitrospira sp.]